MTLKRVITILHFLVGIGAVAGGIGALVDPNKPMGMSTDALVNGPFTNFLIPGLFLFFVLGVGNIVAGIITMRNWKLYPYVNILMGAILCLWIIIQCYVLLTIVFLHVLFFAIGFVQFALGCMQFYHILKRIY